MCLISKEWSKVKWDDSCNVREFDWFDHSFLITGSCFTTVK